MKEEKVDEPEKLEEENEDGEDLMLKGSKTWLEKFRSLEGVGCG